MRGYNSSHENFSKKVLDSLQVFSFICCCEFFENQGRISQKALPKFANSIRTLLPVCVSFYEKVFRAFQIEAKLFYISSSQTLILN